MSLSIYFHLYLKWKCQHKGIVSNTSVDLNATDVVEIHSILLKSNKKNTQERWRARSARAVFAVGSSWRAGTGSGLATQFSLLVRLREFLPPVECVFHAISYVEIKADTSFGNRV